LESNDIDVAIADMTGVTFAEHFVSFLEEKGVPVTSIAKVERNPDQSKHLETAKITVLGRELDLVNLRSEEYVEHSRIPSDVVRHYAGFGCSHVAENHELEEIWHTSEGRIATGHHNQRTIL
jgi:hypothetical protein